MRSYSRVLSVLYEELFNRVLRALAWCDCCSQACVGGASLVVPPCTDHVITTLLSLFKRDQLLLRRRLNFMPTEQKKDNRRPNAIGMKFSLLRFRDLCSEGSSV